MPNVTINVTGQSSGSGGHTAAASSTASTGSSTINNQTTVDSRQSSTIDPGARLVDVIRQKLIDQVANQQKADDRYTPLINQIGQAQRQQIANEHEDKRMEAYQRLERGFVGLDENVWDRLEPVVAGRDGEEFGKLLSQWGKQEGGAYKTLAEQYDKDVAAADEERVEKESELGRTIKELTEEIRKSGGNLNSNSFLNQLRAERQRAILDRDTANDEESAREAAARVRELDERIKDVEKGGDTSNNEESEDDKINWGLRAMQTMMGFDQLTQGIAGRNLGSIIMGAAQTATSAFGMSDKAAARSLAWVKPIATLGTLLTQEAEKSDQMASLAALVRNDSYFGGGSISDTRDTMYQRLWDYAPGVGFAGITDMGMSAPEFAQSAARRIRQRGMSEGGVTEAYFQEALERVFSLEQGALGAAGQYDMYGTNATDAISNLVARLSRIQNSGVSQGNYAFVSEYLNMQQGIMQQLMRFSDRPDIGIANKEIEAFAQLKNYTVDSRTGSDIAAVRNTIVSPQNDRMRAMLYGTIEELMPETAGRSDLIDRAINDPAKQGEIIQAYMQKVENMYGGADTSMGYWAVKSLLSAIESPERRDAIWEGLVKGQAGQTLAHGEVINSYNSSERADFAKQAENYTSEITSNLIKASDALYAGVSILENLAKDVKDLVTGSKSLAEVLKTKFF